MSDESSQESIDPIIRLRRRRRIIVWSIVAVVVAFGTFSNYGVVTRYKLERHKSSLIDSLADLQHVRDSLLQLNSRLRYDTLEIERLAREKYGMSKSGEQVYIIRKEGEK